MWLERNTTQPHTHTRAAEKDCSSSMLLVVAHTHTHTEENHIQMSEPPASVCSVQLKGLKKLRACMMDLFSSGLSDSPWVTLVSGGSLSHFTSDTEKVPGDRMWNKLLLLQKMCGLSGGGVGDGDVLALTTKSLQQLEWHGSISGFTSLLRQTWHLAVRRSHRCHRPAASLTRESVHVPRRSHKPPAQRRSSRGPEGPADQRGLCAGKKDLPQQAGSMRCRLSVKIAFA